MRLARNVIGIAFCAVLSGQTPAASIASSARTVAAAWEESVERA